jgi:hypothetical protein
MTQWYPATHNTLKIANYRNLEDSATEKTVKATHLTIV